MPAASKLLVKLEQEQGCSHKPARVLVCLGRRIAVEVVATVEQKMGADGGFYPCVTLIQRDKREKKP
jgi:hypothetical protein